MLRAKHKELYPFVITAAVLLAVHLFLPLNWSDDAVFFVKSANTTLKEFLVGSARPLTDAMTYIFIRNSVLWRILNPLVLTVLCFTLSYLLSCTDKMKQNIVICSTVFYPTLVVVDAGFVATTVNYLWPITCGLLCLAPLKQYSDGKKISAIEAILLIPLLFYAVNMQQMSVMLFIILFAANCCFIKERKFNFYILIQFLLTTAGLLYSYYLNMFGGNNRMTRETGRYFPGFGELNLFNKAELGFSSTFYCLTMYIHFAWVAFIAFSFFLMYKVIKSDNRIYSKIISSFPFAFSLVFGILSLIPERYVPFLKLMTGNLKYYCVSKATYNFNIAADILFVLICACVLHTLFILLDKRSFFFAFSALFLGLVSRLMMGFSPTVWASGFRTFAVMIISFIAVTVIIMNYNDKEAVVKS